MTMAQGPSPPPAGLLVRETCDFVCNNARHVSIDGAGACRRGGRRSLQSAGPGGFLLKGGQVLTVHTVVPGS